MQIHIKRKETTHWFLLFAISCFLFLNYFLSNDLLALVCTIASCLYLLVMPLDLLIPSMVYLSFFAYIFTYSGFQLYEFLCISFSLRIMFFRKKTFVNGFIGIIIYWLFHLFATNLFRLTLSDIIPFVVIWCLFFATVGFDISTKEKCLDAFIAGHIISSIMGLFVQRCRLKTIMNVSYISVQSWMDTARFSGISYDANFYTILSVLALYLIIYKMQNHWKLPIWFGLIGVNVVFGMMTFSKSFYLCVAAFLFFVILTADASLKKKILKILPIAVIAVGLMSGQLIRMVSDFLSRLNNVSDLNSLTTGRESLWVQYVGMIFENVPSILIGHGLTAPKIKAAHNTYLEIMYRFGLLGTAIDVMYLFLCKKNMPAVKPHKVDFYLIVGLLAILLFNLSAYSFFGLWVCIFMIWVANTNDYQRKET